MSPLETPAYRTPGHGDVNHTVFVTNSPPPGCDHCDEEPGPFGVLWNPLGTDGVLQVCAGCLPDAVAVALADSAPVPVAAKGVRVHVEQWVTPEAVSA